jgi:hypothetical protein
VTRSIEANKHDLRAAIGNSYRDLLAACDGVVGMERDCRDIMTIEAALESQNVPPLATSLPRPATQTQTAASTIPVLPPEWFAKRQRRRRHAAAATAADVSVGRPKTSRETERASTVGTVQQQQKQQKEVTVSSPSTTAKHPSVSLPKVALPLPAAELPFLPGGSNNTAENRHDTADAMRKDRVRLEDELQALHLQYMAAAAAAKSRDGVAADIAAMLAALKDESRADATTSDVDSRLTDRLPLLSLAQRLHNVQEALVDLRKRSSDSVQPPRAGSAKGATQTTTLAWVVSLHRRATTLETRLVKLLLMRLRRTADEYARLASQRAHLERRTATRAAGVVAPPSPDKPSGGEKAAIEVEREKEQLERQRRSLQVCQQRCAVYVCAVLAECHGVLRALSTSPTLLGAFVACAPGVDVPRTPPQQLQQQQQQPSEAASMDSLMRVASWKTRDVVMGVLHDRLPPPSFPQQEKGKQDIQERSTDGRSFDSSRWLLALISVLLLREAQVSAARWCAVAPSYLSSSSAAVAPQRQPQNPKMTTMDTGDGVAAHSLISACTAGVATRGIHPCAFANAALLSALGLSHLPSSGLTASAGTTATINAHQNTPGSSAGESMWTSRARTTTSVTADATKEEVSNTAWALRCFSGLSFLLRGFADYVDLIKGSPPHHGSPASSSSSSQYIPEIDILYQLARMWSASEDAWERSGGHSDVALSGEGARTLDSLLAWRLKRRGDASGGSVFTPSADSVITPAAAVPSSFSPPSPLARESDATLPGQLSRCASATTDGDAVALGDATSESHGTRGLPAAARCRAYVEMLRSSLGTVAELSTTGTSNCEKQLAFPSSSPGPTRSAPAVTTTTPPVTAVSTASVAYVARELLMPLVSSLVVQLARDPVAIAEFSNYAAQQDVAASTSLVVTSLISLLQVGSLQGSASAPLLKGEAVGETWKAVNAQRWWEETRQAVLHEALQRCFTVALQTLTLVESCVVGGLVAAAHSSITSLPRTRSDGKDTPKASLDGEGRTADAAVGFSGEGMTWTFAEVRQTWKVLCQVLQRHTLLPHTQLSSSRVTADVNGVATPSMDGAMGEYHPSLKQRGCSNATTTTAPAAANGWTSMDRTLRSGTQAGRACSAAGINWQRFRTASVAHNTAAAAGGSGAAAAVVLQGGVSEGLFGGEGLEWGQTALHSSLLPLSLSLTAGTTALHDERVFIALNEEQQREVVLLLSGFRERVFPHSQVTTTTSTMMTAPREDIVERRAEVMPTETKGEMPTGGVMVLNGHAAELLYQCLQTLLAAIHVFSTAAASASSSAVSPDRTLPICDEADGASSTTSLYTRVVAWLRSALARVEAQLSYLSEEHADTLPTPAGVIHSYEVSLLLRVYGDVLAQLSTTSAIPRPRHQPPQKADDSTTTLNEARHLHGKTQQLYRKTSSLWQRVLLHQYTHSLRRHYYAQLQVENEVAADAGVGVVGRGGKSMSCSTRRFAGLAESSSWMRASNTTTTTSASAAACVEAENSHRYPGSINGVAYPALPTPALTVVMQRTLRLLHQALYGRITVYSDAGSIDDDDEEEAADSAAPVGGAAAPAAAAATSYHIDVSGMKHQLVTSSENRRVLEQLALASAELFANDLLPRLAVPPGDGTSDSTAARNADDVRLQWLMDTLFISSVWCSEGHSSDHRNSAESLFASSPVNPMASGGADVAALMACESLQRVAVVLQKTCDPIRWRSAVPLIVGAYRQYLSASSALWVTCEGDGDAAEEGISTAAALSTEHQGTSVARIAAMKPLVASGVSGGRGGVASIMELLLLPRERVDRLALLPISAQSSAAVGPAGNQVGMPVPAITMAAPTAMALNPYASPLSPAAAAPTMAAAAGGDAGVYRVSRPASLPSHIGSVGVPGLYDGAAAVDLGSRVLGGGQGGSAAVLGAAGAGASSAAAAASSLWGTTQRSWNQLWGSS